MPGQSIASIPHFLDVNAAGRFKQLSGFGVREFGTSRFNNDEKTIVSDQMEPGGTKQRIIEPRQSIQHQHSEKRPKRSQENGQSAGHRKGIERAEERLAP